MAVQETQHDRRSVDEVLKRVQQMSLTTEACQDATMEELQRQQEQLERIGGHVEAVHESLDQAERIIQGMGFAGFLRGGMGSDSDRSALQRIQCKWMWSNPSVPRLTSNLLGRDTVGTGSSNPLRWSYSRSVAETIKDLTKFKPKNANSPVILQYTGQAETEHLYNTIEEAVSALQGLQTLVSNAAATGGGLAPAAAHLSAHNTRTSRTSVSSSVSGRPARPGTERDDLIDSIDETMDRILHKADVMGVTMDKQTSLADGIIVRQEQAQDRTKDGIKKVAKMHGENKS